MTFSRRIPIGLFVVLSVLLMVALLSGPLWQLPGLPYGTSDGIVHVYRSAAMHDAFQQGVFWPRWLVTDYNGLGTPAFHHYSPGLYWLIAALHGFGVRLDLAIKLIVTAALVLCGYGVYGWLRPVFSPAASLTGVAFFLVYPHILIRSYYYAGDYPRLVALLLLPVCLWASAGLHSESRVRYWLATVASLVALVFTHSLTTFIGGTVLVLFWVALALGYRRPKGLVRCTLAALLASLLSAAFWLPAIVDLSQVQIDGALAHKYDFRHNFLHWRQLFRLHPLVMETRAGNQTSNLISSGIDAATWLALATGSVSLWFSKSRERRIWGVGGILAVAAALSLTLEASSLLWETIPGLSLVQFPFRFLSLVPLGLSPVAAVIIDVWPGGRRCLAAIVLIVTAFLLHFPYSFLPEVTSLAFVPVKGTDQAQSPLNKAIGRDWGRTESDEFLIRGADIGVATGQSPEPAAEQLAWRSPHEAVAELSEDREPLLLRLHFHPGWSAGERAQLERSSDGWVQVEELRNASQPLVIRWNGTQAQLWGEGISLVGLFASIVGLLYFLLQRRNFGGVRRETAAERQSPPSHLSLFSGSQHFSLGAITGCLLILFATRVMVDRLDGRPFLRDSPPAPAFTVEGQPATLGREGDSQITLLGWKLLSSVSPRPGETVSVRLFWQAKGNIKEDLHSNLQIYTPSLKRSWAVVQNYFPGNTRTQQWEQGKYYADDLHLALPVDLPPATFSLVAGLTSSQGERLSVPGASDNLLELTTLSVAPLRPSYLREMRPIIATPAETDAGLRLRGYDFHQASTGATLRVFWESVDNTSSDWVNYIHLHDASGKRIAQFDGPALAGLQSTSQWHTNALYIDRRRLDLPPGLPPGNYLLRFGLYNLESGERLPFQPDDDAQENFENGQLLIPLSIAPPVSAPY